MNVILPFRVFLSLFVFPVFALSAQDALVNPDYVDVGRLKSVNVYVSGNKLSYPAISLDGDESLLLVFDELGSQANDYTYKIVYCNSDWSISDLFYDEFAEGFAENRIGEYDFSKNTTIAYVNYRVLLPNDDVRFKLAGNYLIQVFENQKPDRILLSKRFVVYESLVTIEAELVRPMGFEMREVGQEMELKIVHNDFPIRDPLSEVKITISQNNRADYSIYGVKPAFIRNNELDYKLPGQILFNGGNEFHTFDFSDQNKFGLNVNDVRYLDTMYHVQLRLDEARRFKKYFWEKDLNGKNFVNFTNNMDADKSADYAYVYFYLPMNEPFLDANVYVTGELCQWQCNADNKMTYNFEQKTYEARLLLKQGYYDYIYTKVDSYTQISDELKLEGSHFQTENDYNIYVYYRGFGQKHDRLVGYRVVNSKYKN